MNEGLLLDTNALLYWAGGTGLSVGAQALIAQELTRNNVIVSSVNAWEIATLHAKGRYRFDPDPLAWWLSMSSRPGIRVIDLEPVTAIGSYQLPEPFHSDPADRMLVSIARHYDLTLLTSDTKILAYGQAGHVKAVAA